MHPFLKFLVVLVALAVLGPPALAAVAVLLGITLGLAAFAVKVGVFLLAAYAVVWLLKSLFGGSPRRAVPQPISARESAIDDAFDDLKRREDEQLAALNRELARATRAAS